MSERQWRRRPPPRAASMSAKAPASAGRSTSALPKGATSAMAPTAASSGKRVARKAEDAEGNQSGERTASEAARWRELRRSVRVRASMDAPAQVKRTARIADLCEEDRDKVAQLVRRVVEIGTIHEESEAAFERERVAMQREIIEMRAQAKKDAVEMDELGDKLRSALLSVREYQEHVAALEESNEAEIRARHEAEQTMDMLRVEVDKLRGLVQRLNADMQEDRRRESERHQVEIQLLNDKLRETQGELIQERENKIKEKQRELDARLEEQAAAERLARKPFETDGTDQVSGISQGSGLLNRSSSASPTTRHYPPPSLDISSFLNTSIELPETIRAIMDEWKQRMEEALAEASSAAAVEFNEGDTGGTRSAKIRADGKGNQNAESIAKGNNKASPSKISKRRKRNAMVVPKRLNFERNLHAEEISSNDQDESDRESDGLSDPASQKRTSRRRHLSSRGSSKTKREVKKGGRQGYHRRAAPTKQERRIRSRIPRRVSLKDTSSSNSDRADGSTSESFPVSKRSNRTHHLQKFNVAFDQDGDKSNAQIYAASKDRDACATTTAHESSFVSLYETSLFDVVDAIESVRTRDVANRQQSQPDQRTPPVHHLLPESIDYSRNADTWMHKLRTRMEERERKLGVGANDLGDQQTLHSPIVHADHQLANEDAASIDEFAVFDAVKELYSREVFEGRRKRSASPGGGGKAKVNGDLEGVDITQSLNDDNLRSHHPRETTSATTIYPNQRAAKGIQEAIETDMEVLLREDPLVRDLFLTG